MRYVTEGLVKRLASRGIPAIGFVNEGKLYAAGDFDERVSFLRMWVDAGLDLGNHTYSHISIDRVPLSAYKDDVIRGEVITRRLLREKGKKLRFFRHTQLRTGPSRGYKIGLERFLRARGYTIAPVTVDSQEFMFAVAYDAAKRIGDMQTLNRVGKAYIEYMDSIFDFYEKLSVDFLGYEMKQTLLLHANELNADYFDQLVGMMERRGYAFISLDEALKDTPYSLPDAQALEGLSWIHRWMLAKGLKIRREPREPEWIRRLSEPRPVRNPRSAIR